MFRNVVVGMDGGPGGHDALALAQRLAAPDATITLAHVYASGTVVPSVLLWIEAERQRSAELLTAERDRASVPVETASIGATTVGEGLHRLTEQLDADLLVVGSTRQGVVGRVAIGDETRAALNGAPCAVAIASRDYAANPTRFVRIGVGYDFSPEAEEALDVARRLAERDGSELEAVNAVHMSLTFPRAAAMWASIQPDVLEHSRIAMSELDGVTGTSVLGDPRDELVRLGRRVDLLVVGSRGYGPVGRMLLGSTSTYLQRHAKCPLLVMRRGAKRVEPEAVAAATPAGAER